MNQYSHHRCPETVGDISPCHEPRLRPPRHHLPAIWEILQETTGRWPNWSFRRLFVSLKSGPPYEALLVSGVCHRLCGRYVANQRLGLTVGWCTLKVIVMRSGGLKYQVGMLVISQDQNYCQWPCREYSGEFSGEPGPELEFDFLTFSQNFLLGTPRTICQFRWLKTCRGYSERSRTLSLRGRPYLTSFHNL